MAEAPIGNNQPGPAGQPGQVIAPGSPAPPPQAPETAPPQTPAPEPEPAPGPAPEPTTSEPAAETPPVEAASEATPESVSWTASEFIAHDKSAGWYVSLIIGTVIVSALIFLVTKDAISVGVIVVAALILGVYGGRQPRQLQYRLDRSGLTIAKKHYQYDDFKFFSVAPEGAFSSINFMPLKRFAPAVTVYFAPEDEEKIMAVLSGHLPYEEPRRDAVDSLMRRIRF